MFVSGPIWDESKAIVSFRYFGNLNKDSSAADAISRNWFKVHLCRPIGEYVARAAAFLPEYRDLLLSMLGEIWALLHLPFGRWIWAVGEKSAGDGI